MDEHNDTPATDASDGRLVYLVENLTSLHASTDLPWLAGRFEFLGEKAFGAALSLLVLPDDSGAYRAVTSTSPRPASARDLAEALQVDHLATNTSAAAVFGQAEAHGRPMHHSLSALFPEAGHDENVIVVPIAFNREMLGVGVFVAESDDLTEALASILANHAAVALHQLREREEARRLHAMDARLWVPDQDFLLAQMRREVARARRYGREVGLALIRLDNETAMRAQFGDFYTDHMMRRVGSQLMSAVRDSDVVGALEGGYAIIHTETSSDGTKVSADRLGDAVASMIRQRFPEAPAPRITVRTVAYPASAGTVEDLVEKLQGEDGASGEYIAA